jgi:hypothetical protein
MIIISHCVNQGHKLANTIALLVTTNGFVLHSRYEFIQSIKNLANNIIFAGLEEKKIDKHVSPTLWQKGTDLSLGVVGILDVGLQSSTKHWSTFPHCGH